VQALKYKLLRQKEESYIITYAIKTGLGISSVEAYKIFKGLELNKEYCDTLDDLLASISNYYDFELIDSNVEYRHSIDELNAANKWADSLSFKNKKNLEIIKSSMIATAG
jgi:hypothetical protein